MPLILEILFTLLPEPNQESKASYYQDVQGDKDFPWSN